MAVIGTPIRSPSSTTAPTNARVGLSLPRKFKVQSAKFIGGRDFGHPPAGAVSKMKIALREVKGARRWLRLLRACRLRASEATDDLERESGELAAIFAQIVINVKRRLAEEKKMAKTRQVQLRTLNFAL